MSKIQSAWKRMFELKQEEWIDVCKEVDKKDAEIADLRAKLADTERREREALADCMKLSAKLAARERVCEAAKELDREYPKIGAREDLHVALRALDSGTPSDKGGGG